MEPKPIKDLTVDDKIERYFVVRRKDVRTFSRGQFITLELGEASGRVSAVMWEPDQWALTDMTEGQVVKVRGAVGEYNGKRQINIMRVRPALPEEYTLDQLLPSSTQTDEQRKARLLALTEKIENTYIRTLAESFWSDQSFMAQFLTAPAGKLWHHAFIGGLSEHSANVAELALRVALGYDWLNKDYLIFGGLFHDAGKLAGYSVQTMIDYSDEGRLVGHICVADQWVCERAAKIEQFPPRLLMKLRHMILSHQGEYENATPVLPQMPEAFVLYYSDEIDAKMGAIDRIRTKHHNAGWSEYVKLLERFLYFGEVEPSAESDKPE